MEPLLTEPPGSFGDVNPFVVDDDTLDTSTRRSARDLQWRAWALIIAGLLIAIVVLLALLYARKPAGGGCCPTELNVTVLNTPLPVEISNDTLHVLIDALPPVVVANDTLWVDVASLPPVEVVGMFPSNCSVDTAQCFALAADSPPLPVDIVDANCTINVTIEPIIQSEIIGPFGGSCALNESFCVSLAVDQPPLLVDVITAELNVSLGDAVVQTQLVGPFGGECTANESLCVSLAADQAPLLVDVQNAELNVSLGDAVVQTQLVGPFGGECTLNESLCVSLAADQAPLLVDVVNAELNVSLGDAVVQTQLAGPFGGVCTLNESLCVSLATDSASLPVEVLNDTLRVSLDGEVVQTELVGPLGGSCALNESLCVSLATDSAPINVQLNANQTDQFSRVRVAQAHTIFDVKLLNPQADPLNFDNQQVSGAGTTSTYVQARASILLGVAASTAGHRVRQSLRRVNYQPGKQTTVLMTLVVGDTPDGITKRWGYFDQSNGVFFEARNGLLFAVRRTSVTGMPVDNYVDITATMPAAWSPDNGVIYGFDFVWLGVGEIQWYVYVNGYRQVVYTDDTPLTSVTMSNPNNPLRYEILNDGTGPAEGLECICASIQLEGGVDPIGWPNSVNRGSSLLSIGTDGFMHSLLAVRLRDGYQYAEGFLNDWTLTTTTGNVVFLYEIRYRPTVIGPALVWTDVPNSPYQVAIPVAANTLTGGELITSGYVSGTAQTSGRISATPQSLFLGSLIDGTRLELHLAVERLAGGGADSFLGAMGMRSIF